MNTYDMYEKTFKKTLDVQDIFTPYRLCPLGAHVDHQHGIVTGFAIDKGVNMVFTPTEDGSVEIVSCNFSGKYIFNVNDEHIHPESNWCDYAKGACESLKNSYKLTRGIKAVISGSLPIGGLSSSASVIITYIRALAIVNEIQLTQKELIKLAMWVENSFLGISVGKLDQSCEVYSKTNSLLFLDTKDDYHELIPQNADMKPYEFLIIFSGLERSLINSGYNTRVDECRAAAYALKGYANQTYGRIKDTTLREVSRETFEDYKMMLPESWRKRATHFYNECERVHNGILAWKKGNIEEFGKIVFESGRSSIYNYETGSEELKALSEIMENTDGIYGGRFSGAGFKGCSMAIIDPAKKDYIMENIEREYTNKYPTLKDKCSLHICHTANGVILP